MGFFFIAVGMGINLGMIVQHPLNVIGFTVGLLAIKGFGLYGLRRLVGGNAKVSRMQALALAQCGEFAFVLFGAARASAIMPAEVVEQLTLAVALSMAIARCCSSSAIDTMPSAPPRSPNRRPTKCRTRPIRW